jgi:inorganic triphosphatase YgiF
MAGPEGLERELKMDVGADFVLPAFDGLGAQVEDLGSKTMTAVYWDTNDLRLARSHYGVRHRTDGAWTVKGPSRRTAVSLLERSEDEFPGDASYPPSPVVARIRGAVGEAQLQPAVQLVTQRKTLVVHFGGAVVEVVHDRVAVNANGTACGDFCEVELEIKSGDEAVVTQLAAELSKAGAKPSTSPSKYIRALHLAGRWR